LTRLLFEDCSLLLLVSGVAILFAVAYHRRRFTPRSREVVYFTILVCISLLVIQKLVVTRRESLHAMIETMVKAVDDGGMTALGACLDETGVQLGSGPRTEKRAMIGMATLALQEYSVDNANAGQFSEAMTGDGAEIRFQVSCELKNREDSYHPPSSWA